mmetsp:Transcript_25432/g.69929  ORF Transcript_25432/g.69929 Transcript_25432/m.69929 type:complete len:163 (+) Transcript_25432:606-1094(+)
MKVCLTFMRTSYVCPVPLATASSESTRGGNAGGGGNGGGEGSCTEGAKGGGDGNADQGGAEPAAVGIGPSADCPCDHHQRGESPGDLGHSTESLKGVVSLSSLSLADVLREEAPVLALVLVVMLGVTTAGHLPRCGFGMTCPTAMLVFLEVIGWFSPLPATK